MKNMNDFMNAITMIKNFNDAHIFDATVTRTTTFYNDIPLKPNYLFTDDGERVVIDDAIEIIHNGKKYYIDVQRDACYIYIANGKKRCFELISYFWYKDYKNITSLQLAIIARILTD